MPGDAHRLVVGVEDLAAAGVEVAGAGGPRGGGGAAARHAATRTAAAAGHAHRVALHPGRRSASVLIGSPCPRTWRTAALGRGSRTFESGAYLFPRRRLM